MKKTIILFLFALIFITSLFCVSIDASDEFWNFQNIYKLHNGFTLYTDANAIITPLFYYIGLFFFKIFGATILTFRIYNIAIFASYLFFYI